MIHQFPIEAIYLGQGQLEHDLVAVGNRVQTSQQGHLQMILGLGLGRAVDINLRLQDGHHALGQNTGPLGELLVNDGSDTRFASLLDHRTHLGTEDPFGSTTVQELFQARVGLHQLDAIRLVGQSLVDLEERNHTLGIPQVLGRGATIDLTIHRALEKDGPEVTAEGRAGDDAGPHGVDLVEHLVIAGIRIRINAVLGQSTG